MSRRRNTAGPHRFRRTTVAAVSTRIHNRLSLVLARRRLSRVETRVVAPPSLLVHHFMRMGNRRTAPWHDSRTRRNGASRVPVGAGETRVSGSRRHLGAALSWSAGAGTALRHWRRMRARGIVRLVMRRIFAARTSSALPLRVFNGHHATVPPGLSLANAGFARIWWGRASRRQRSTRHGRPIGEAWKHVTRR